MKMNDKGIILEELELIKKEDAFKYVEDQVNPGCLKEPYVPAKVDKKYDVGKPMVGLVKEDFPLALLEIGKIARYGILKYEERGSWKKVEDGFNRYKDALGRHDLQSQYEDIDEESGHLHLAHMAWNCLALLQFYLEEEQDGV